MKGTRGLRDTRHLATVVSMFTACCKYLEDVVTQMATCVTAMNNKDFAGGGRVGKREEGDDEDADQ